MDPKKIGAGIIGTTALVFGGVDASKLDEKPIERTETVAGYTVEAKQIENRVETSFPWKDQPAIKVVYDMGQPTLTEKFKDKRKKEVVTEAVNFGDGGFKVDILLDEKPDTNVFCYAIQGAENYDFFYQPPLTEQDIAEGASRPPEIDGSYAVYHKTLANHIEGQTNYETGKVMHIPRPQVWSMSDVETKVWADMNYDNGNLCVTVPQDFLDKAEYPVRVDPTFGYTTAGATEGLMGSNDENDSTHSSLGAAGTVTDVTFYARRVTTNREFRGGIYRVSDVAFLAGGNEVVVNSSVAQWWTSTGLSLSVSATNYYVAFLVNNVTGGDVASYYYDTVTAANRVTAGSLTYPTWPTTGSIISSTRRLSIYATYTASGGSSSTTPNQNIILFE